MKIHFIFFCLFLNNLFCLITVQTVKGLGLKKAEGASKINKEGRGVKLCNPISFMPLKGLFGVTQQVLEGTDLSTSDLL